MKISLLFIILLFLFSCKESSNISDISNDYSEEGKAVLIAVVENSNRINSDIQDVAFASYRGETVSIFSDLFDVPESELIKMDLNEIIELYGEPWQIENIKNTGAGYYDEIVILTDDNAEGSNLLDTLKKYRDDDFTLDIIFCLHGNQNYIFFNKKPVKISDFTQELISNNIKPRLLYQTNCRGASALQSWNDTQIQACNGTPGTNYITMFSPQYFIEEWVKGKDYIDAVNSAFNREIETLKGYNNVIPVIDYIVTESNLSQSRQIFSGRNISINKNQHPK